MKFRKKPIVVEAEQYTGPISFPKGEKPELPEGVTLRTYDITFDQYPVVETLEGVMNVKPGDWIVKGVKGEVYPCHPDIFESTYEKI